MFKIRNTTIAKLVSATAFVASLLSGAPAHAGLNSVQEVFITSSPVGAGGAVADARFSSDAVQYIGCQLSNAGLSCFAKDSAGRTASCLSTSPTARLEHALAGITGESWIRFTVGSGGVCSDLQVQNASQWKR